MKNVGIVASITHFVELSEEALHRATGGTGGGLPEMASSSATPQPGAKNGEAFAWDGGQPGFAAGGCMLPEAVDHAPEPPDAPDAPEDTDGLPESSGAHVDDVGDDVDGSLPEMPDDMPDEMSDEMSDDMSCMPEAPPAPAISCSGDEVDDAKEVCDLVVDAADDLGLPGGHDWSMGSGDHHDHEAVKEIVCKIFDVVQQSGLVCHA